jgi:hypothetical protein
MIQQRVFCAAIVAFLLWSTNLVAEGKLEVHNGSDKRIQVAVTRSSDLPTWARVDIPPKGTESIRLVSQDLFNVRIFHFVDGSDVIEEYGVNQIDVHRLSDTPGGGTYRLGLYHWRTWHRAESYVEHRPYRVAMTVNVYGQNGVARLSFGEGSGYGSNENYDPPRPPRLPPKTPPKKNG